MAFDLRVFRDDDRDGFELRVLRGPDGDFHVSVWPCAEDMPLEERAAEGARLYSNSVRIRSPMIGGGEHERLYHALATLFNEQD